MSPNTSGPFVRLVQFLNIWEIECESSRGADMTILEASTTGCPLNIYPSCALVSVVIEVKFVPFSNDCAFP